MAIIKLLTVLGIALLLIRLRYELWVVLLIASLATALLYGLQPRPLLTSFFHGAIGPSTIRLILAVYLITTLGEVLKAEGYFTRLIGALEVAVRDVRFVLAIPPILLGLLPMPAGAMMSAPIVGEVGDKRGLSPEEKTFINFWFRHIWEYAWPLYPGVILASTLIAVPIESVVRSQLPLVLIAAVLGFGYIFLRVSGRPTPIAVSGGRGLRPFFISIWPILAIIVLVLLLKVDLIISLSSVVLAVFLLHRLSGRAVISCLGRGVVPKTFLLLCSVMIFRQVLEASGGVGAFSTLPAGELTGLLAFCAIPFIVGLLTGVTVAFVGVAIPIFLHLLQGNLNMLFLLYVCGFAGVLLSPTHLCLVVTKEYFGADFLRVYRRLLPLAGAFMAIGFLISYLRGLGL